MRDDSNGEIHFVIRDLEKFWVLTKITILPFFRKIGIFSGITRVVTNYIALESLLKKRADLKKIFISDEWASHKLSRTTIGREVEGLMFNHPYWEKVSNLVSIYEALYTILYIVDFEIVPIMPFVYELIRVMKQNLHALKAKEWVKKIIADH